ncbi:MAG: acyl carrier protein [Opitutaceae bacterium]
MISPSDARLRVQENLTGFPPPVVDAYLAFADTGDLARLDDVVLGVLQFYLAKPPAAPLTTMPGATRLVADLGCDSLTMIDVMFLAEALLGIKLADDELVKIDTLDELRAHFRGRMMAVGKTAA